MEVSCAKVEQYDMTVWTPALYCICRYISHIKNTITRKQCDTDNLEKTKMYRSVTLNVDVCITAFIGTSPDRYKTSEVSYSQDALCYKSCLD